MNGVSSSLKDGGLPIVSLDVFGEAVPVVARVFWARHKTPLIGRYQQHTGTLPVLEATGEEHDFTQEKAVA